MARDRVACADGRTVHKDTDVARVEQVAGGQAPRNERGIRLVGVPEAIGEIGPHVGELQPQLRARSWRAADRRHPAGDVRPIPVRAGRPQRVDRVVLPIEDRTAVERQTVGKRQRARAVARSQGAARLHRHRPANRTRTAKRGGVGDGRGCRPQRTRAANTDDQRAGVDIRRARVGVRASEGQGVGAREPRVKLPAPAITPA